MFETLFYGVACRVYAIVEEFENEVVPRIIYGEIFLEDPVKALFFAFFGSRTELEELLEGLQLHFEEVVVFQWVLEGRKTDPVGFFGIHAIELKGCRRLRSVSVLRSWGLLYGERGVVVR